MMEIPKFPELTFDEKRHIYQLNSIEIPSVTTLMKPLSDRTYKDVDPDVLKKAAERGTSVHMACENYALYGIEDCPLEYMGYFDAFKRWWDETKPVVLAPECQVYHKELGYAGTTDLLCEIRGVVTIVDYKTTAKMEPMLVGVQLEGYGRAWDSHGVMVEDRIALHLQKAGKYSVNHFPKNRECWDVLNSLLKIHNYVNKF